MNRKDYAMLEEAYLKVEAYEQTAQRKIISEADAVDGEQEALKKLADAMRAFKNNENDANAKAAMEKAWADTYIAVTTTPTPSETPSPTTTPAQTQVKPPEVSVNPQTPQVKQPEVSVNPQTPQVKPPEVSADGKVQAPATEPTMDDFERETGTKFRSDSVNDRLNLALMRKGKETLNSKQANAYRRANPNWTPDTV